MKSGNADGAKARQEGGMDTAKHDQPAAVPEEAAQAGENRARPVCVRTRTGRWVRVEPSVWTDRMLEALEQGVKGGKWHRPPWIFDRPDGWIRQRLRSILRRRRHRKGRARGPDRQRSPNAGFAENGLFSMTRARAEALRSP